MTPHNGKLGAGWKAQLVPTKSVDELEAEVFELRRLLGEARAQRDATQRALDKANRDNDVLRAELRALEKLRAELAGLSEAIGHTTPTTLVDRFHSIWYVGRNEVSTGWYSSDEAVKSLIDHGGAGYFVEDEEE